MEKVHFSTYLSFFQTSGSSELYEDNEIFVKQFKLFFKKNINQETFSISYKEIVKVHVNMECSILHSLNHRSFRLLISGAGEVIATIYIDKIVC